MAYTIRTIIRLILTMLWSWYLWGHAHWSISLSIILIFIGNEINSLVVREQLKLCRDIIEAIKRLSG